MLWFSLNLSLIIIRTSILGLLLKKFKFEIPQKNTKINKKVAYGPRPGNQSGYRVVDSKLPNLEVFPPTAACSSRREHASPGPWPGNQSRYCVRSRAKSILFGPEYSSWNNLYPKSTCNFALSNYIKTFNNNDNDESQNPLTIIPKIKNKSTDLTKHDASQILVKILNDKTIITNSS